jgi:hypothetical protein
MRLGSGKNMHGWRSIAPDNFAMQNKHTISILADGETGKSKFYY